MQPQPPPGPPPSRFPVNPRTALIVLALAGGATFLYLRHRSSSSSSSSGSSSTEAPPDNTYEQSSSATAEFGQQAGEIANLGNSVAAAQAAESSTQGNLATEEYLQTGANSAVSTQLRNQQSQLNAEKAQIAAINREIAGLKRPAPKKKPARK